MVQYSLCDVACYLTLEFKMLFDVLQVRAKAEDNNTQKFGQQEHKTCKSTTPVVTKSATNSSVIKRNPKPSKPVAPVFRPPKLVQQVCITA